MKQNILRKTPQEEYKGADASSLNKARSLVKK